MLDIVGVIGWGPVLGRMCTKSLLGIFVSALFGGVDLRSLLRIFVEDIR